MNSFKKALQKKRVDLAIFFRTEENLDRSIAKLCNIFIETGSFFGMLYYPASKKQAKLVVSSLEVIPKNKLFSLSYFNSKEDLFTPVNRFKPKVIGLNEMSLTITQSKFLKKELKKRLGKILFKDISKEILEYRQKKSAQELSQIKKAVRITETIFEKLYKKLSKYKTENEVIAFLKKETIDAGCELSYEPIVASGKNAAKIHYHSKPNTPLEKGFCVIDFAVNYKGYHADITRTPFLGKPSKKDIEHYELVKDAQSTAEKMLKINTAYSTIFEKTKKIGKYPLKHALGHGIGLQVHELPHIGYAKEYVKENDTIAIEPGIYVRNEKKPFGIRIEDNYVITKKGPKRLSKSSRDLKLITF